MTDKRFKVTDNTDNPFLCDWNVTDYADGGIVHHPMTSENMANVMCNLLNELHEENQDLKSFNKDLAENLSACANARISKDDWIEKLTEENGQLRTKNNAYIQDIEVFKEENTHLKLENEELKQFQDTVFVLINEMIETANLYRTPIKSLDYGEDLGYWNGVYQKLKELKEILEKEKGNFE